VWRQALLEVIHQVKERHPGIFNSRPFDCASDNRTVVYTICVLVLHSCNLLTYNRGYCSTLGVTVRDRAFVHGQKSLIASLATFNTDPTSKFAQHLERIFPELYLLVTATACDNDVRSHPITLDTGSQTALHIVTFGVYITRW
jgi:hypothetical protein